MFNKTKSAEEIKIDNDRCKTFQQKKNYKNTMHHKIVCIKSGLIFFWDLMILQIPVFDTKKVKQLQISLKKFHTRCWKIGD